MVLKNDEIMAAAEARAAWQRTANRYFVQEDAKRAPKLASCPSTSSSSTQQNNSNNNNSTIGQENPTANFVPLNWNSMNSKLPPDTRWWLQLQLQEDFTTEQLNKVEEEVESVVQNSTLSKERLDLNNGDCPLESRWMVSTAFTKQNFETRTDEMKTVANISQQPFKRKVDVDDYLLQPGDRLISKKTEKVCPDLDSPWGGGNKCEPWWRISDQDELASLVAQKSLEHIENCDLPRPTQTVPVSRDPFACLESLDSSKIFSSSVSCNLQSRLCDPSGNPLYSSTSGSSDENYWSTSEAGYLPKDSEKLHCTTPSNSTPISKDLTFETTSSRDQLLEALCHSQTRAREAEIAAQKAYREKEHIIKLFFRQASHLFAYRQCLRMLQLESLCLQLRIKEHQFSTLFPVLPWMPLTGNETTRKGKKQKNKCSFCKYAVIFAVGLGLAGAGLFLGWLLPHL